MIAKSDGICLIVRKKLGVTEIILFLLTDVYEPLKSIGNTNIGK